MRPGTWRSPSSSGRSSQRSIRGSPSCPVRAAASACRRPRRLAPRHGPGLRQRNHDRPEPTPTACRARRRGPHKPPLPAWALRDLRNRGHAALTLAARADLEAGAGTEQTVTVPPPSLRAPPRRPSPRLEAREVSGPSPSTRTPSAMACRTWHSRKTRPGTLHTTDLAAASIADGGSAVVFKLNRIAHDGRRPHHRSTENQAKLQVRSPGERTRSDYREAAANAEPQCGDRGTCRGPSRGATAYFLIIDGINRLNLPAWAPGLP